MKIRIRTFNPKTDTALIYDSWIRCVASSNALSFDQVDDGVRKLIDRVLSKPSTEVRIAVDAEDSDFIHGLAVVDQKLRLLHFVYVKKDSQQFGVCGALLQNLPSPLTAWWCNKNAGRVAKVVDLLVDPLALMEI